MNYKRLIPLAIFLGVLPAWATHRYQVAGLVLRVDAPHRSLLVSHDSIPGYMDAMTMPYTVRNARALDSLHPGMKIGFTLVVTRQSSYLDNIRVISYDSLERDPFEARRFGLLAAAMEHGNSQTLQFGQTVPDFSLVDQRSRRVTLSQFQGKVVAITFIYTRCPLPDYCFRLSNNFRRLQKRFDKRLGRDLVLLSVTFDPANDTPAVLARYAEVFKADGDGWRFLTGPPPDVQRVCAMFGMNFWPDEGTLTHSLHTVIVGRSGQLVTNIEGNQFTADQLGDLVEATLADEAER